ncbi:MAG TPA: ATP-binding protein [Hyphomonadaceae bacterium]|jgi:signal transduction histidine kinase/CheY-like chemotaxis protein|nr:ATP-binding protein [Hyphomonadaceae bacterium]
MSSLEAAKGGASANPASGPAPVAIPRFSWAYINNSTCILGVILAAINGLPIAHFFGPLFGVAFAVPAVGLLLAVCVYSFRALAGDERARVPANMMQAVLITLWMISATAFWMAGTRGATALAMIIPASWAIHIIFSGRGDLKASLGSLSICAAPLLGFLLHSVWSEYPLWLAIPTSVSSFCMVLSIASSAQLSAKNFNDLQAAVAEAAATRTRLEFAIQSAGDGYFEIDFDTMMYTPNPALARGLGFDPGPKDMSTLRDRIHPDDTTFVFQTLDSVRDGLVNGWKQELRIRVATGGYRWMQLRCQAIQANAIHGRKLIGTVVDMTAWKNIEADLRAAKEVAENSSAAKSQFLANMSHEIRTPLNGVLGMAQALEADGLTPTQKEKVGIILDSGKSLTALLNDVLDLTKIEAGKLEISAVPGDFLHTMKRTRQLFQSTAEDKGLDLFVRYDSNFPQRLSYDPVRVRQCVSNLLSNAIKFTSQGEVEVHIAAKPLGEGAFTIAIDVKDSGIGMSRDVTDKLFTVFTQADGATTRKFGGSGLGLAISRQLARMMGGDITVTSQEGRGSTFHLTFKAQEAHAAAEAAPAAVTKAEPKRASGLRGMRVLLTDDNAINRQVIKLFLAPQGCEISEATNGKEALDKVASGEFDIVLLDVHMPVMDGKEAIKRIRANEKWQNLPVIALTADAMSGDREKYLALGMTDYVSKPVDQRELVAKMHAVLRLDAPAGSAPAPSAKTGTTGA